MLYPHYQAPIPSMAIVQFELDPEQVQLTTGYTIPRHTELETEPIHGEPCRFRTCYPVTLWPIELQHASLAQAPLPAPATTYSADAVAVLRLGLSCPSKETTFAALGLDTLRFFLKGQPQHVYRLYELIFNHTIGVALAGSSRDLRPPRLGRDGLQPGRLRPRRGDAALPGSLLPRLPAADRILRVSRRNSSSSTWRLPGPAALAPPGQPSWRSTCS